MKLRKTMRGLGRAVETYRLHREELRVKMRQKNSTTEQIKEAKERLNLMIIFHQYFDSAFDELAVLSLKSEETNGS